MAETTPTPDAMTDDDDARRSTNRRIGEMAGGVVGVMDNARSVAQDLANQLPGAAETTRQVMNQASEQMRSSSDEMLIVGSALAFGVSIGLFVSGSNRFFITAALIPAAAMAATLLDRRSRGGLGA